MALLPIVFSFQIFPFSQSASPSLPSLLWIYDMMTSQRFGQHPCKQATTKMANIGSSNSPKTLWLNDKLARDFGSSQSTCALIIISSYHGINVYGTTSYCLVPSKFSPFSHSASPSLPSLLWIYDMMTSEKGGLGNTHASKLQQSQPILKLAQATSQCHVCTTICFMFSVFHALWPCAGQSTLKPTMAQGWAKCPSKPIYSQAHHGSRMGKVPKVMLAYSSIGMLEEDQKHLTIKQASSNGLLAEDKL